MRIFPRANKIMNAITIRYFVYTIYIQFCIDKLRVIQIILLLLPFRLLLLCICKCYDVPKVVDRRYRRPNLYGYNISQ